MLSFTVLMSPINFTSEITTCHVRVVGNVQILPKGLIYMSLQGFLQTLNLF